MDEGRTTILNDMGIKRDKDMRGFTNKDVRNIKRMLKLLFGESMVWVFCTRGPGDYIESVRFEVKTPANRTGDVAEKLIKRYFKEDITIQRDAFINYKGDRKIILFTLHHSYRSIHH